MKKKILVLMSLLTVMLVAVGCSPNMKAYMTKSLEVSKWDSKMNGTMKINMEVKGTEENKGFKFEIPVTYTGKQKAEAAEINMKMDFKNVIKAAGESGVELPESVDLNMIIDKNKIYIEKDSILKAFGKDVPKELKDIKEQYIALDFSELNGMSSTGMKYLQSSEYQADVMKLLDTALKGYTPKVDMKVEGNKFTYEASGKELSEEIKGVIEAVVKNWASTSGEVSSIVKKMGMPIPEKELNKAVKGYNAEEFNKSLDEMVKSIEGSKIKYDIEFKDNSYVQNMNMTISVANMFNYNIDMTKNVTKAENVKINIPTSVKVIDLKDYMTIAGNNQTIIMVAYNGEFMDFKDQEPVIVENRTLVPFRALLEKMGAEVKWDAATKTVTAVKDGKTIELTIGKKEVLVDGKKVELDVPAEIMNNRTMIPLRFVSENLGYKVKFDNETKGIYFIDVYNISDEELAKKYELPKEVAEDKAA